MKKSDLIRAHFSQALQRVKERCTGDFERALADDINVSYSTVKRWVAGYTAPHPLLFSTIFQYAVEKYDDDKRIREDSTFFKAVIALYISYNQEYVEKLADRFAVNASAVKRWGDGKSMPQDFARPVVLDYLLYECDGLK